MRASAVERLAGSAWAWPWVVVAAAASCVVGVAIGNRFVMPVLNAALAYPVFIGGVAAGRRGRTVALLTLWALAMSVAMVWLTTAKPGHAEIATLHGAAYRDEMFAWIRTGIGKESTPSQFLPDHALHFAIFCAAALLTGGFAALVFGAALLNYMNFYVGSLALHAERPAVAATIGWPPYAEIRVVGFVVVAVALTELALRVVRKRPLAPGWGRTLAVGVALVILDVVLKTLVAPHLRDALSHI
jgi:hypothetical protein